MLGGVPLGTFRPQGVILEALGWIYSPPLEIILEYFWRLSGVSFSCCFDTSPAGLLSDFLAQGEQQWRGADVRSAQ